MMNLVSGILGIDAGFLAVVSVYNAAVPARRI
jgi:hypothetical protein